MNTTVLLASGSEDTWEDVQVARDATGALLITDADHNVVAVYAQGMWMKYEC